jgi:hypothetical protein
MGLLHTVAVALALSACPAAFAQQPPITTYNVEWLTPSNFDGSQYTDGMPTGNGDVVVLGWGNATAGSLDFFVRSAQAMHTDSTLFTIALVSVALSPNPFATGSYWNQTLHLDTGAISILGGGSSFVDYEAEISLYVDANSPTVVVTAQSRDGVTQYDVSVTVRSVRPATRSSYSLPFVCNDSSTGPDVIVANPTGAGLPTASVALYHVNSIASGDPAFFHDTLVQQHLDILLNNFSDPLDGRIFGMGVTGAAGVDGSGAALARVNASVLSSKAPAPAFYITLSILVQPDAQGNATAWLNALGTAMVSGPHPYSVQLPPIHGGRPSGTVVTSVYRKQLR